MRPDADDGLDVGALVRAERERIALQVADLTDELGAIVTSAAASLPDDEHDAEGSTVGFERARVSALLDHALRRLAELDAALDHAGAGDERCCEACRRPIPLERLAALPATRTCAPCSPGTTRIWAKKAGSPRGLPPRACHEPLVCE